MENEVPGLSLGRRSRLTRGNGVTTDFAYDSASRLTLISHKKPDGTVLSSFAYTFDQAGSITEMRFANGDVAQYDYDAKDQLTAEHRRGTLNYDITFTYDPVGNRLKQVRSGDIKDPWEITYSYNAGDELLRESNRQETTFYGYDPNGNTTSKTVYRTADLTKPKPNPQSNAQFRWDYEDRIASYLVPGPSKDSLYESYADWWNRNKKKVNMNEENYLYDRDEILLDYNSNGNVKALYVNGPRLDERLATIRDGQVHYYLCDHLGSVRQLTDNAGYVKNTYDYEAFGATVSQSENVQNRYKYAAREWDKENQCYYCRWRLLNPQIGRFLTKDPSKWGFEAESYLYLSNNPVNETDPTGLGVFEWVLTGEWSPSEDVLEEAMKGWVQAYGKIPGLDVSLGQIAYTGQLNPTEEALKAGLKSKDMAAYVNCYIDCMECQHKKVLNYVASGALTAFLHMGVPKPLAKFLLGGGGGPKYFKSYFRLVSIEGRKIGLKTYMEIFAKHAAYFKKAVKSGKMVEATARAAAVGAALMEVWIASKCTYQCTKNPTCYSCSEKSSANQHVSGGAH